MKRKCITLADKAALVKDWRQSQMKMKQWCRKNGVVYSSFCHWRRQVEESPPLKMDPTDFLAVCEEPEERAIELQFEIKGVKLQVFDQCRPESLQSCLSFLKELSC